MQLNLLQKLVSRITAWLRSSCLACIMLATPPVHTLHSIMHDAFTCWLHFTVYIYVMRKPWIGTIHGLRCSKYGSLLCAGNPWIAQHLRDPWIAQPHCVKHSCKRRKVISREKGKDIAVAYLSAGER